MYVPRIREILNSVFPLHMVMTHIHKNIPALRNARRNKNTQMNLYPEPNKLIILICIIGFKTIMFHFLLLNFPQIGMRRWILVIRYFLPYWIHQPRGRFNIFIF